MYDQGLKEQEHQAFLRQQQQLGMNMPLRYMDTASNANRPNQRYSLEQMRFLNKIKNASKR